jgi:UDP-N-acetyl-D-galactosamine dehydrogenase
MLKLEDVKLAVVGLGYVGLPLAVEFGKQRAVVGFDVNQRRVKELRAGHDATLEVENDLLVQARGLEFTTDPKRLESCNVYIVTVPTPIDEHKRPDLTPLVKASETIGKALKHGDIVIYESTVYPGATEEECVPVLEKHSGLIFNVDFFAGYSPERINPGDKEHRVTIIKKVTSGSTPEVADLVDALYREIIIAGTHMANNITPITEPTVGDYDGIVVAVAHRQFVAMGAAGIRALGKAEHVLYDLKYVLPAEASDLRL